MGLMAGTKMRAGRYGTGVMDVHQRRRRIRDDLLEQGAIPCNSSEVFLRAHTPEWVDGAVRVGVPDRKEPVSPKAPTHGSAHNRCSHAEHSAVYASAFFSSVIGTPIPHRRNYCVRQGTQVAGGAKKFTAPQTVAHQYGATGCTACQPWPQAGATFPLVPPESPCQSLSLTRHSLC